MSVFSLPAALARADISSIFLPSRFFSGPEGGMDKSVGQVLGEWGKNRGVHVRVEGAERWTVGEGGEEVDELES